MRSSAAVSRAGLLLAALCVLSACDKVPPKAVSAPATPAASSTPAAGASDAPKAGVDYVEIKGGAPYEPVAGKIEVVEVFGYTCPHCAHFEPLLEAWRAKQPADVNLVTVPAPFGSWWMPFAKAYFAAKDLGLVEKTHAPLFAALHEQHTLPTPPAVATDAQIAQFYARYGADPADFARRMEGAQVAQQMHRAEAFINRSGVDGTPGLVVAGRYRVLGRGPEDALRIIDALVARERAAAH